MNTDNGRYISPNSDVLTGDGRHGKMSGEVGEGAITIRGIKVLDKKAESIELGEVAYLSILISYIERHMTPRSIYTAQTYHPMKTSLGFVFRWSPNIVLW